MDKHFITHDLDHLDLLIRMPVCTTLDLSVSLLATLWIPQMSQLGVSFSYPESNLFWSNCIAINQILSGLKLLHVHGWHPETDLRQIIASLPMLETLIISAPEPSRLNMDFFRPMDSNGTSGLNESNVESQATMLCHVPCWRVYRLRVLTPENHQCRLLFLKMLSLCVHAVGLP